MRLSRCHIPKVLGLAGWGCLLVLGGMLAEVEAREVLRAPSELVRPVEPPRVTPRVLERVTAENASILVNLTKQRAYLLVGDEVAIDTPISSGKASHPTPTGSFTITQMIVDHRSNIYGNFVDSGGRVVRAGVSSRIDSAPSGTRFLGAPMRYWMRLTDTGIGLHVGHLPGYPASHGCVRLPEEIAAVIYQRVKVGTPVRIIR